MGQEGSFRMLSKAYLEPILRVITLGCEPMLGWAGN